MIRAGDNLFAHEGSRNKENNATKDLRWLIVNSPWSATKQIIKPIFQAAGEGPRLNEYSPEQVGIDTQKNIEEVVGKKEEAHLVGLAPEETDYINTDIEKFSPKESPEGSSILDLVIYTEDGFVIGVEAKLGEFNESQLQKHAQNMDAKSFGVSTWSDIRDSLKEAAERESFEVEGSISESPLPEEATRRLLEEYVEFLHSDIISIGELIGESGWGDGENTIKVLPEFPKDKREYVVTNEEPDACLVLRSKHDEKRSGHKLHFAPDEWKRLIGDLDEEIVHQGFAEGSIEPMIERLESEDGTEITLAQISNSEGDKKYMRFSKHPDTDDLIVKLNRVSSEGGNLRYIPMWGGYEVREMFGDSPATRLFTEPEEIFGSVRE
jgi:hypothetical protein